MTTKTRATVPPPLRLVRKAKGLSQEEVAELAGLDQGWLSRAERGEANLSVNALYRIARALEMRELELAVIPYVSHKP